MEKRTDAKNIPRPNKPKPKGSSMATRVLVGFLAVVAVMVVGVGCGFLTASMNTKPDLVQDIRPSASSHIYDINGVEIANVHATENREPVKLSQIPQNLQDAFIAVEDNRFYEHMGVDPRGIARAAYANLTGRTVTEGGSTITQQLAKNAYLTQERTLKRKIQEIFLALQLERQYSKQEILELYLNQIYFGDGAYGVQAAARTYFGKNVEDLDLDECAMLAGIPKSPNYYSPFNSLKAAQERKATVLDQMEHYGYIDAATANKTKAEVPKLVPQNQRKDKTAAYFIDYVVQKLIDKYGADKVYKDGLKIYTTLDLNLQKDAEAAAATLPAKRTDSNGVAQPEVALIAIDPHNGYIKAMVGGRGQDQFNRATMAERQPGSSFKPFVFAAAIEENYGPDSVIDDSPVRIGNWAPHNYDGSFHGRVTLRQVAEHSLNVPTVKIAQKIGIDKPIYYAQQMGITTLVLDGTRNDRSLSTALGGLTKGVTPLELVSAYGTFDNKGVHVDPVAILKVIDRDGNVLEEAQPQQKAVLNESTAAIMTDLLQSVVLHGTGGRANIGRPMAGKTGTTDDWHDAWFVGYTPELVAGVWVGNDDNSSMGVMTGGMAPAEIWKAFMTKAVAGTPVTAFDGSAANTGKPRASAIEEDGNSGGGGSSEKSSSSNKRSSRGNHQNDAGDTSDNASSGNGNGHAQGNGGGNGSNAQQAQPQHQAPAPQQQAPAPTPAPRQQSAPAPSAPAPTPGAEGATKQRD